MSEQEFELKMQKLNDEFDALLDIYSKTNESPALPANVYQLDQNMRKSVKIDRIYQKPATVLMFKSK